MRKLIYLLKIIIVNIIIFSIIILNIEILVRFFHPEINAVGEDGSLINKNKYSSSYGYFPNKEGYSFGSKFITDSNGFRINPKSSFNKKNNNILILGDSVTIGVGVDSENIFSSKLQSKLKSINIINASATGYTFSDYLTIMPQIISDKYVGVILCLCLNDFDRTSQKNIVKKINYNEELDRKQRYPIHFVEILRDLNDKYFNFNDFLRCHFRSYLWMKSLIIDSSKNHFLADFLRYKNITKMPEVIRDQFDQLVFFQKNFKSWLLIVILPYEYQLRTGEYEFLFPQQMIMRSTEDLGLDLVDLYSPLRKYVLDNQLKSQDLFLYNDPCHFSSEGHKIIADIMFAEINKRGLLSSN